MRLLSIAQLVIKSRYAFWRVAVIVISSVYPVNLMRWLAGKGMSDIYRLKKEGTPVLKMWVFEFWLL